jgi:hypothetical protein
VKDGKVTEFRDFAMGCARAFGAAIMMRDEPGGQVDVEKCMESTDYHDKMIEKLRAVKPRTDAEILAEFDGHVANRIAECHRSIEQSKVEMARYEGMLEKVEAWQPPSSDHVKFKEFMVSQLKESISHDSMTDFYEREIEEAKSLSPEEYVENRRGNVQKDIEYHEERLAEIAERNASRRKWVEDLAGSFGEGVTSGC